MKLVFLKQFDKDLDRLVSLKVKTEIADIIDCVENASKISEIANIKKLKGYKNAYRIRVGDYRIGIFIEHNTVEFARVIHRKDIYKLFP